MPPVECLVMLSDIYNISINEILAGERVSSDKFSEIAEQNIAATLKDLEKENQVFERRLMLVLAITSILAIITIILLPMETKKDIIVFVLVIAITFIANSLNAVALIAKKNQL